MLITLTTRRIFVLLGLEPPRTLTGGQELAEERNGSHQDEAGEPNDRDRLVRMAQGLPSPGPQRVTDAVVPLHRNHHQRPRRDRNGSSCREGKKELVSGRANNNAIRESVGGVVMWFCLSLPLYLDTLTIGWGKEADCLDK